MLFTIQIYIACAVPTGIFLMLPASNKPFSIEISGQSFTNVTSKEIGDQLKTHYGNIIENGEIILDINGNLITIPYKMFELQIDASKIFAEVQKGRYSNMYYQLIDKPSQNIVTKPLISFNSAKLKNALYSYNELFYREPQDAALVLQQGIVKTTPGVFGHELSIDKAQSYIRNQLEVDPTKKIIISQSVPDVFDILRPEYTEEDLNQLTVVYGMVQGEMTPDSITPIQNLVNSIRNKIIEPGEEFSYKQNISCSLEAASYNAILASAIYRAALPVQDIKVTHRLPTEQPVSGINPGFEVNLEAENDLKFVNSSDSPLMLVFDTEESGFWTVALVGRSGLTYGEIITERTKILPPVIYSQDNELPEKSQEVIEQGREGLSVKVLRVTQDETIQLYEDIYQPVYKIIAIGSGVKNEDIVRK